MSILKKIMISGHTMTGKTMVALALAAKMKSEGKSVSYFKPIGRKSFELSTDSEDIDDDAFLMKHSLGLQYDITKICPIARSRSTYEDLIDNGKGDFLDRIEKSYQELSESADVLIIEGTMYPWNLLHIDLSSPQIAKHLDASVLCLVNFTTVESIDEIFLMKELFSAYGVEFVGFILSKVPPILTSYVKTKVIPFLKNQGFSVCGVIDDRPELFSPNIREILKALDGQMISGEEKMDLLIDKFMVGSMASENALKYFRRAGDKAVITSGDRCDICQAALETDTNLLILTGGMGPDIRTIARAKELGVPIMMTAFDTYSTSQIVDKLEGDVRPDDKSRLKLIEEIINNSIDFDCFLKKSP